MARATSESQPSAVSRAIVWFFRPSGSRRPDLDTGAANLPAFVPGEGPLATRKALGKALNAIAGHVRELVGGPDHGGLAELAVARYCNFRGETR